MKCSTERFTLACVRYALCWRVRSRLRDYAPGTEGDIVLGARFEIFMPIYSTRTHRVMCGNSGPLGLRGALARRAAARHHVAHLVRSGGVRTDTFLDPHGVAYRFATHSRVPWRGLKPIFSEIGY